MVPPSWISATDLNFWANRREAQEILPQLVRRLIHATTEQLRCTHFPAGDSVQIEGWDGVAYTEHGNAFVPVGLSAWEFGANKGIKGKADDDYEKRSADPRGITPAQATFIFVTPRRWTNKNDWIQEKNQEKIWAEVIVYDADDLEQWLEAAPAVHTWLSKLLGKWSEDTSDLGSFWEDWTQATIPPLSLDLHLEDREDDVETLKTWLTGDLSKLTIQADSPAEAIAFLAAVIHQLPEAERLQHLSRCVLAETDTAWRSISRIQDGLILVPTYGLPQSIPTKHHVFIPISQEHHSTQNCLKLSRPTRTYFRQALQAMGLSVERSYDLTKESKRNLLILRRLLAKAPELLTPDWAKPESARSLIPALLAGAWDEDKDADRDILAKLARKPYSDFVSDLTRWKNCSDPFIRQVGSIWQVISREDAWRLLVPFLLKDDLEILEELIDSVLDELDPRYDLPVEQQVAAIILGKTVAHSGALRQRIAETLAFLTTRTTDRFQDTLPLQNRVNSIVYRLLSKETAIWKHWASLSPFLIILAEAAPDVFLRQLEQDLRRESPAVIDLFTREDVLGGSPHTYLLWALETLAWHPDYLLPVALILSQLVRLEPGGKLLNRPVRSLRTIFQRRAPQTTATLDERLKVIDRLLLREPEVAWQLLCSLLPSNHEILDYNPRPNWRDWVEEERPKVTETESLQIIDAMVDRMLDETGVQGVRWCNLLESIADLPDRARDRAISRLQTLHTTQMDAANLVQVWNKLRSIVHDHSQYPDATWAMPAETVDQLYLIYEQLKPQNLLDQYAWMFRHNPELIGTQDQDWEERHAVIQQAQGDAAESIYVQGRLSALLELAKIVEEPGLLGQAIAKIKTIDQVEIGLLEQTLESDCAALNLLARSFVAQRRIALGWNWVDQMLAVAKTQQWSMNALRNLFLGLPCEQQTWTRFNAFDSEIETLYWQCVNPSWIHEVDGETAIRRLLNVSRPCAALNLASIFLHGSNATTILPPRLLVEILESAASIEYSAEEPTPNISSLRYRVEKLLQVIEQAKEIERHEIARLEWLYIYLLVHGKRQPKLLHEELSNDPLCFIEVLKAVYRSEEDSDPSVEITKAALSRASAARELLESWCQIPGLRANRTVDPDALMTWVTTARTAARECKRSAIADYEIGKILAYAPKPQDGTFPDVAVRDLIEVVSSEAIESSFETETYNKRGAQICFVDAGGEGERKIASTYRTYADLVRCTHPRTAAMLRRIAETYQTDAHLNDLKADLTD